jgi:hypothetical protein
MGLLDVLGQVFEGYEQGKVFGEATALLKTDRNSARGALIMRVVRSNNAELDLFDDALFHIAQNALTRTTRQHAAETLALFRDIRETA